jgi:hypothetical protein
MKKVLRSHPTLYFPEFARRSIKLKKKSKYWVTQQIYFHIGEESGKKVSANHLINFQKN